MENNIEKNAVNDLITGLQALVSGKDPKKKTNDKAFNNIEASIQYGGSAIILPDTPAKMSPKMAMQWLATFDAAQEQIVNVCEDIDAYPWDGAVAFMQALKEIYGWASPVPTPGFFGNSPPQTVSIDTAFGETALIFWGLFKVPGLEDTILGTGINEIRKQLRFQITGKTKRKNLEAVHHIAELTRQIVRRNSIYKGKAIRLVMEHGSLDMQNPPLFMDLRKVDESQLIFSDELMEQVETNLFTPIRHTQFCRDNKVPLKRGVLLEGPYGTGKTMAATVTAKLCEQNGWTFVTVPEVAGLKDALQFASNYQPCVVFVEDIDRSMSGERTVAMDDVLNTIDGVVSKNSEIMVVLTSNHVANINRAMLRPGRLDAILRIDPPDAKAVERLIRVYGGSRIKKDQSLELAGKELAGRIPAVIQECVQKAKLYSISHRPGEEFMLTDVDIQRAAIGMRYHLQLLDGDKPAEKNASERLGDALIEVIDHGLANGLTGGLSERIKKIDRTVETILDNQ